jgi:ribonuclease BN (tRNA processing enzyme)
MSLSVTVLGSSGSYAGPGGACSGYLLRGGGVNVLVDLGPGSLANLQLHMGIEEVDAVVLSHRHADHWVDLSGLATAWKYVFHREGLPVYGGDDTRAAADALLRGLEPTIAWTTIADGGHARIGDLQLDFSSTEHYVETLAVRAATDGVALGYSADTGPGWSMRELGPQLDLALCEATTLADGEGEGVLHLSARQAGATCRDAGASRLVLTHFLPGVDRAASQAEGSAAYGAAVEVASEHATFTL